MKDELYTKEDEDFVESFFNFDGITLYDDYDDSEDDHRDDETRM